MPLAGSATGVKASRGIWLIRFMPEARINLAQATIHLALAPKSNAVIMAIDEAMADVRAGKAGAVPPPLRDGHYAGAAKLGHAQAYLATGSQYAVRDGVRMSQHRSRWLSLCHPGVYGLRAEGLKTQAALAQYQLSQVLPASGMLDDNTLRELAVNNAPTE